MNNGFRREEITFKIVASIGKAGKREVNLVSWNGREPKVDIREWSEDHSKMGRGLTLTTEEEEMLCMILHEHMRERSK